MRVKPFNKHVGVEELFGGLALEFLFNNIVVLFVTQPYSCRNGEAKFFFFGGFLRHMANSGFSHCVLRVRLVAAQSCGERGRNLENLLVEERNTQLKRVSHTHSVGFKKNIADHPHIYVKILHLCNVVVLSAAVVVFSRVVLRTCCD